MSSIEAFDNDRLVGYLNRQEWSWLRTQEGAFIVDLTTDFGLVRLQLAAQGEAEAPVLLVRVGRDTTFGPDDWLPLLSMLNSWNGDYRYAKAFMHFVDDNSAVLLAETQVPMGAGVHDELLDLVIDVALAAAVEFHRYVFERADASADANQPVPPAPSAHELEAWLDRSGVIEAPYVRAVTPHRTRDIRSNVWELSAPATVVIWTSSRTNSPTTGKECTMGVGKLHKAGQKRSAQQGGGTVRKGTQKGPTSKLQRRTHEGKNRSVNHSRRK